MKLTIEDECDIQDLVGTFVVQIDIGKNIDLADLNESQVEFYLVKRIRYIVNNSANGYSYVDLTGWCYGPYTIEKFIKWFNQYDDEGSRYHRKLKGHELKKVFEFISKRNY